MCHHKNRNRWNGGEASRFQADREELLAMKRDWRTVLVFPTSAPLLINSQNVRAPPRGCGDLGALPASRIRGWGWGYSLVVTGPRSIAIAEEVRIANLAISRCLCLLHLTPLNLLQIYLPSVLHDTRTHCGATWYWNCPAPSKIHTITAPPPPSRSPNPNNHPTEL